VQRLAERQGPQSDRCARARARPRVRPGLIAVAREGLDEDLVQAVLVGDEPVSIDSRLTQYKRFSPAMTCLNRLKHRLIALVRIGALEFDPQEPRSFPKKQKVAPPPEAGNRSAQLGGVTAL
jgi:hypothetical protein